MDWRMFDQLDRLERGARIDPRAIEQQRNDSSAGYSAYDEQQGHYGIEQQHYEAWPRERNEFVEQPMTLDSFDEQLLRQPDHESRQGQASLGRARITLPPQRSHVQAADDFMQPGSFGAQRLNLSQFAYEGGNEDHSTSSPFNHASRSSPAYKASQRRPEPFEYATQRPPALHSGLPRTDQAGASHYQATGPPDYEREAQQALEPAFEPIEPFQPNFESTQPSSKSPSTKIGPPVVQGIDLVPTQTLPDRFRALYTFPLFNAVQSKCFDAIYKTNDNFVLSAPTGSGKTAVLELAICRLINKFSLGSYKIVYQAPTKSLCSERHRDWQAKFGPLDLQCAELTGDTDAAQLRNVQHATIIITTPEKWDSVTRKWKDQQKLMKMVKLFLIDEVHILKEDRGATLEAVVSRMKSVGSDVRFVALSATIPNAEDIATWLGKDPMNPSMPAARERFGEEFRPVRLKKHVAGYQSNGNDFAFEKTLNGKLPEVITKWSQRKPIMIFCFTRSACVETAKLLATWWSTKGPRERYWEQPRKRITVGEKDLSDTIISGVAFHHAGLTLQDRLAVEKGYLDGEINVICCTSTLAVGVNLPCHMVIIKGTVTYQSSISGGCKEYSDLEMMQMLGRAGRPQFDDSAVAVIMTRTQKVSHYEKMISGQEVIESCLHLNLIDHLNAEIGLGTITGASSAKKWLSGTFLYVRLKEHPEHYKLDGDPTRRNLDERLEHICSQGLKRLEEHDLVNSVPKLHSTEFGDAMARYYIQFDTMKIFLAISQKAKISEILSAVSQAAEFRDVRFRSGEKSTYKDLNKNTSIKFPIPGNMDLPSHKTSLIIQSVLGAIDLPSEDYKQRLEYNSSRSIVFTNAHRLIRCIIDCQLYLEDAVTTRNALMLARSIGAQVWDDSPLHIKQLDGIGLVYVRKLVAAGIKSIEDLENTDSHRIEQALSRNPPWGKQLQDKAKAFPKLRVSIQMVGEPLVKKGEHATVKLKAELGFLNDKVPITFQRKPVYVCLLAETSDGHKVHFARISAKKLDKGQDVLFSANLTNASQSVRVYAMCDEIAGSSKHASVKPKIPASAFPDAKAAEEISQVNGKAPRVTTAPKRKVSANAKHAAGDDSDEFGDLDLDEMDLSHADADVFVDIDELDQPSKKTKQSKSKQQPNNTSIVEIEPTKLANGKWACNHTCKDKTQCKHLCCREGTDKKPKPKKVEESKGSASTQLDPRQTQLGVSVTKKAAVSPTTTMQSGEKKSGPARKPTSTKEVRDLDRLHNSVKSKTPKVPILGQARPSKALGQGQARSNFFDTTRSIEEDDNATDYGVDPWDSNDLPSIDELVGTQPASTMRPGKKKSGYFQPDDEMLDMDQGADNVQSQAISEHNGDGGGDLMSFTNDMDLQQDEPWQLDEGEEDSLMQGLTTAAQSAEPKKKAGSAKKSDHLFVGYSTDSAANDPGISQTVHSQKRAAPADFTEPDMIESKKQKTDATSRRTSTHRQSELERFEEALPAEEFIAQVEEADGLGEAERPSSADSLKKWAVSVFGDELFNYTW